MDDDIFGGMGMRIEAATHGGSGRGGGDHGIGGDDGEYDVYEYVEESDSEYDSGVDEYGKHSDSAARRPLGAMCKQRRSDGTSLQRCCSKRC